MASEALSLETQAILDRLIREGKLTRNSDNNSLKTIIKDTSKFLPVFESIQATLTDMNTSIKSMVGGVIETVNTEQAQSQSVNAEALGLSEEYVALQKKAAEISIRNDLADEERREKEEAERKEKEADERREKEKKERADFYKNNTLSGQMISNPLSFFTKLLKGAAIAFVGFNVVRGIVDQWTGGKFTEFVEGIDYEGIGKGIKEFTSFLSESPWAAFATAIGTWAMIDFGVPLAVNVVGEAIRTSMLVDALNKGVTGGIEGAAGFSKTVLSLRGALFSALGVGVLVISQVLADKVRESISGMTPEQIENETAVNDAGDVVDVVGMGLAGMTMGRMFGPKGMIVGGIIGLALGIGKKVYDHITSTPLEKIEFEELEETRAREQAEIAKRMLDEHRAGVRVLTQEQIDAFKIQALGPTQEIIDDTNDAVAEQVRKAEQALARAQAVDPTKKTVEAENSTYNFPKTEVVDITDASELAERERTKAANVADAQRQLDEAIAKRDARIKAGYATLEDMTYVAPEGFGEELAAAFGGEGSADRRKAREEEAALALKTAAEKEEDRQAFLDSINANTYDYLSMLEDKGFLSEKPIIIVKGGDSQTNVDSKDQSVNLVQNGADTGSSGVALANGDRASGD